MRKVSLILVLSIGLGSITYAQTINIGTQVWMTKNLEVSTFRNGDPIPEAKTAEEWKKAGINKQPAWCYYKNDPANGAKYGKLYNWHAVNDPRGLAPKGWHVPSDADWQQLTDYLGGWEAGGKMKSTTGWTAPNIDASNRSGFSGLPGGVRDDDGTFSDVGNYGSWWSSTEFSTGTAWNRYLYYKDGDEGAGYYSKASGFSVRCIRD